MAKHDLFKVQHKTGATRSIQFANGTVTQDRCIANIGELQGKSRNIPAILCDGAVEQDHWNIINLVDDNGMFLNHVAVRGAVSENQQNELIERYFQPILADSVVHSSQALTDGGLQRFLDEKLTPSNTNFLLLDDANHFNHRVTKITPLWDEDQITSHNGRVGEFLLDMVRHDDHSELLEQVTPQDLIAVLLDGTEGILTDAMMLEYKQFDRVIKKLGDALQKQGDKEFYVENVTPIAPFKKNGVVNVGVIFEMNDTQTVTVLFNNPDSTPAKLTPSDVLTSWKWMLNKRDVTAALQPKAKESKRYTLIAQRMMQLLVKNHGRFQRAAGERLRIERELEEAQALVDQKKQALLDMDQQIADEQAKIDAIHAEKQANSNADVAPKAESPKVTEYSLKSTNPRARKPVGKIKLTLIQDGIYEVFGQEDSVGGETVGDIESIKQWIVGRYIPMGTAIYGDTGWDYVKTRLTLKTGDDVLGISGMVEPEDTANEAGSQADIQVPEGFTFTKASDGYWVVNHQDLPQSVAVNIFEQDQGGYQASFQSASSTVTDDLQVSANWAVNTLNDFLANMAAKSQEEQDLINDWESKIPPELDQEKFKKGMEVVQKHVEKSGLDWNTADAFKFVANTSLKFLGADQEISEFAALTNSLTNTANTMSRQLFAIHTNGKVVLGSKGKKASQEALEQYALEHFTPEQKQAFTEQQKQAEIERVKAKQQEALGDIKAEIASIWNGLGGSQTIILKWLNEGFKPEPTKVGAITRYRFTKGNEFYKVQNNNAYRSLERMIKASNQIYGSFENALIELGALKPETTVEPEQQPEVVPEVTAQPEAAAENMKEYFYTLNARPIGVGALPKDGFIRGQDASDGIEARYGLAVFNRLLTDDEMKQYELKQVADNSVRVEAIEKVAQIVANHKGAKGAISQYQKKSKSALVGFAKFLNEQYPLLAFTNEKNMLNEIGDRAVEIFNSLNTSDTPEQSPDEAYLNQVIDGSIDLSGQDVGDRLEQIGENLPPELEPLFEQAADAYAAFAIENAKRAG